MYFLYFCWISPYFSWVRWSCLWPLLWTLYLVDYIHFIYSFFWGLVLFFPLDHIPPFAHFCPRLHFFVLNKSSTSCALCTRVPLCTRCPVGLSSAVTPVTRARCSRGVPLCSPVWLGTAGHWPPCWLSLRPDWDCCWCADVQGRSPVWVAVRLGLYCVGAGPSVLFWEHSGATHHMLCLQHCFRATPWCWGSRVLLLRPVGATCQESIFLD